MEPSLATPEADERVRAFFAPECRATTLDLSSCNLHHLPPSLESHLLASPLSAARLTLLNLAHNSLTTLPRFLSHFPRLSILFLLDNAFTALPPILPELSSVTMLSFKSNALSGELPASLLPPRLSWLILTSNRLTSLSPDFPTRCRNVRKLMLANNNLTSLPRAFGTHMHSLELLRLSNNNLHDFPYPLLDLPRLAWLSVAGNPCTGGTIASAWALPAALCIADLDAEYSIDWARAFGSGTSGAAFPGTHRSTGARVAVKRFRAAAGSDGRALDEVNATVLARGVGGVVQAVGYGVGDGADGEAEVTLVMERVEGDAQCVARPPSFESCTRCVYEDGKSFGREEAERIVDTVERAVEGLLERGVAHGDVYGHNVMVGAGEVVLGDLGAAWTVPEKAREGARRVEIRAVEVFREEIMRRVREE